MTAEKLAAELGVSIRTIYYDVSKLSCFVPIQTVPGRYGGGIKFADWFHPEAKRLSDKQVALLIRIRSTLTGDDLLILNSILAQFAPFAVYQ